MKVSNFFVKDQFVIEDEGEIYFQSYDKIIVKISRGEVTLDEKYYNYSPTTSKYRNLFLKTTSAEVKKKIRSGEYKLADLNKTEGEITNYAKRELEIFASTRPNSIISQLSNKILGLCKAFGELRQSDALALCNAMIIAEVVKRLCLQEPISDLTGHDDEWVCLTSGNEPIYQNVRCSGLFKYSDGKCYYENAIVWQGENESDKFKGWVYVDDKNFEMIESKQLVGFPFIPITFYIDVVYNKIDKEEAERRKLIYKKDINGECYYITLKDPKQLEKVFKHYNYQKN